jgi:FkbM family methyltransferase
MLDIRHNGAYWLGSYDSWILERINVADWLPESGVAWDCGAFVGYYSAIFRRIVGDKGHVLTFEASSKNYEALRHLPSLNRWTNVEVVHSAVGKDHTTVKFAGDFGGASGPLDTKPRTETGNIELVRSAGLDELCYEQRNQAPDFLKLDLEGAEIYALHNGDRLFTTKRPVVLLEVHGPEALRSLGDFLPKYQYCVWDVRYFNQPSFDPYATKLALEQDEAKLCNTLVCLPAERVVERDRLIGKARSDHSRGMSRSTP